MGDGWMRVYMIDWALFIVQLPNNKIWCIDTGYDRGGRFQGIPFIKNNLGQFGIEGIIISHFHPDHVGGASHLIQGFHGAVETVYSSGVYTSGEGNGARVNDLERQSEFKDTMSKYGIDYQYVKRGDILKSGIATIEILGPKQEYVADIPKTTDDPNDEHGVITRFRYGDFSFLYLGDIRKFGLEEIFQDPSIDPSCTILQAGHHGDSTRLDENLLNLWNPAYVLVEPGTNNEATRTLLGNKSIPYAFLNDGNAEIIGDSDGSFTVNRNINIDYILGRLSINE